MSIRWSTNYLRLRSFQFIAQSFDETALIKEDCFHLFTRFNTVRKLLTRLLTVFSSDQEEQKNTSLVHSYLFSVSNDQSKRKQSSVIVWHSSPVVKKNNKIYQHYRISCSLWQWCANQRQINECIQNCVFGAKFQR